MSQDRVRKKTVLRDAKVIGEFGECSEIYLSPNERLLLIEPGLQMEPMFILDLDRQQRITVEEPAEVPEIHYGNCLFRFVRWSSDSSTFFMEAMGTTTNPLLEYRELWEVDAQSGRAVKRARQEKPWELGGTWEPWEPSTPMDSALPQ
jgi:hypothetical protein